MLSGIDHVVLNVADVERSVTWYVEHFAVSVERLEKWRSGEVPFVSLRVSETCLIDLVAEQPTGTNVDHMAFVTDRASFDAFADANRDQIEMGPKQLFGARGLGDGLYLRDPDGHRVELRTYD